MGRAAQVFASIFRAETEVGIEACSQIVTVKSGNSETIEAEPLGNRVGYRRLPGSAKPGKPNHTSRARRLRRVSAPIHSRDHAGGHNLVRNRIDEDERSRGPVVLVGVEHHRLTRFNHNSPNVV